VREVLAELTKVQEAPKCLCSCCSGCGNGPFFLADVAKCFSLPVSEAVVYRLKDTELRHLNARQREEIFLMTHSTSNSLFLHGPVILKKVMAEWVL